MDAKKSTKQEDLERLAKFRLMDDDFMSVVFNNNIEATQLVVDIILKDKNIKVKRVVSQKRISKFARKNN